MVALITAVVALSVGQASASAPGAPEAGGPGQIKVGGTDVFEISASNGVATPQERAHAAQQILDQIAANPEAGARVILETLPPEEIQDGGAMLALRVNGTEVMRIGPADVASSGLSAAAFGQSLQASLQQALDREHRHVSQQHFLEAISLSIFFGLLLFLLLRALREGTERARVRVEARLAEMRGLRLGGVLLLSPETLEGSSYVLVGLGRLLLQFGLVYAYLIFVLTRFAGTGGLVAPLNGALTAPFAALAKRVVGLFPLGLLTLCGVLVIVGALRLSNFMLRRVASGEFQWTWLPRELAAAMTPLVRVGIVVLGLLMFGPLLDAGQNDLFTRLVLLILGVVGLALAPTVAGVAMGVFAIVGRRFRPGEWVQIGGHVGEVTDVGYFGLTLVPAEAGRIWLPHLLMLWHPVRHFAGPPSTELDIPVDPAAPPAKVLEILNSLGGASPTNRKVEALLRQVTPQAAIYCVRTPAGTDAAGTLARACEALAAAGVSVGGRVS